MLVAAPNASAGLGTVFAFSGSGSSYSYIQFIEPAGGASATSKYAQAVAIDGTGTAAIIEGAAAGSGTATDWLFTKTAGNWFAGPSVTPPDNWQSVAIDGGAFVVSGVDAAYAYAMSGGTPQLLVPSDFTPDSSSAFGKPIAMSGNTLLVGGEPWDTAFEAGHFGYIFVKSGTTWVQQAKLVPDDLLDSSNPHFQFHVALDGSTAVLATTSGAYVFVQTGTSWTQVQKILPPTSGVFGAAVDLSGDLLVIGAPSSAGTVGAAYLYGRSNGVWIPASTLATGTNADGFGASVAVSGRTVVVGAPSADSDGAVYLFSCQPAR